MKTGILLTGKLNKAETSLLSRVAALEEFGELLIVSHRKQLEVLYRLKRAKLVTCYCREVLDEPDQWSITPEGRKALG